MLILPLLVDRLNCAFAPLWAMVGISLEKRPDDVEYCTAIGSWFGTVTSILPEVARAVMWLGTISLTISNLPLLLRALT